MSTRLEELKARHARELAKLTAEENISALIPDSVNLPTISNISDKPGQQRAWLSFYPDYGQDAKAFALGVLTQLEADGWKPVPVTFAKYGDWRGSANPGLPDDQPDKSSGSELVNVEPLAPLWLQPCQFMGCSVLCFYEKGGDVFRVCVSAPLQARLSCRRSEYRGGWRFDGPCTVQFPQAWHALYAPPDPKYNAFDCVAHISQHTRGYRDTEQGISGVIYWQPLTEQAEFPLTPAAMLAQLFALQQTGGAK